MEFNPITLPVLEKQEFIEFLKAKYHYSDKTISYLFKCLTIHKARTRNSRAKARWAHRRYKEYKMIGRNN